MSTEHKQEEKDILDMLFKEVEKTLRGALWAAMKMSLEEARDHEKRKELIVFPLDTVEKLMQSAVTAGFAMSCQRTLDMIEVGNDLARVMQTAKAATSGD